MADALQAADGGVWRPHPGPQTFMLSLWDVFELLFGGARGGGKTEGGQAWLTKAPHFGNPLYRALVVRRNYEDLCDWMDRARRMIAPLGGRVLASGPPRVEFDNGAVFRCGHLKDKDAYTKYQGGEFQRLLIEEAGRIPDERSYELLLGSCRSTLPEPFRSAWRYGDWDIYTGQAFAWSEANIIDPCPVPDLPLDERTYDDVDTDAEDHVYDEACHACMEVPLPGAALRGAAAPAFDPGAAVGWRPQAARVRAGSLTEILRGGR